MIRTLYDTTLRFSNHPRAEWVLFIVAFMESSFFPIPPDVLLIPMVIANFDKAFRYALICTLGSVLGGIAGYALGYFFFDSIGMQVVQFYGAAEKFETFRQWYSSYDVYIVAVAGISPIPYKVVTIASGMLQANFVNFVAASAISRGFRFFLISWLLWRGGASFKGWLEKNLYPLTMALGIVFILLVVLFKVIMAD